MSDEHTSLTQHISEAVLAAVRGTPALNCGADPATMGRHEEMLKNIIKKLDSIDAKLDTTDRKLDDGNAKFENQNIRLTKLETEKSTVVAILAGAGGLIISIIGMLYKK
jgi:peptidoglycan hydrolase CwlO-like protein